MSQENVEILKRAIDAFDRRDIESLALLMTSDFEWFGALLGSVEGGSYSGRDGMERYFADAADTWEEFRSVTGEFRDLDDRVLAVGRLEGRGKGSGVLVDVPYWMLADFRNGELSKCRAYLDRDEALRAAGLAE
jgi:ketosteroid isomerase-like protein